MEIIKNDRIGEVCCIGKDSSGETQNFRPCRIQPLQGTYQEKQAKWVEFHGIKVGSKVKVVREAKDREDGWGTVWISDMTDVIGSSLKIRGVYLDRDGISCLMDDGSCCSFPYFVLEPVKT